MDLHTFIYLISQQTESKSIMWLDIDDDGDLDFYYSDADGRVEIIENIRQLPLCQCDLHDEHTAS